MWMNKYWWFVDCFALLAMTVHPHCHCEGRRPVAISLFLARHCETSQKSWQSRLFLACHCESCLQLVAIHKKLKIEAQSGKMISLLNHFSLLSYEVRNERSIRNWKLKINISFKINSLTWLKVVNFFSFLFLH